MRQPVKLIELYRTNREEFRRIFRYLVVGAWNTVFGVGLYTALIFVFQRKLGWKIQIDGEDYLYLVLAVPANILAITNAYICHKIFVFRTRGNIIREYLRCYLVYGGSMLLGMGGLYILVTRLGISPELANIMMVFITVACSYLGHKYFSFRRNKTTVS